jgi:hypothetical protein
MARSVEKIPAGNQVVNDLERYHRLVELQKQIIALAQQNAQARQACNELRELVATEVFSHAVGQRNLRQKANRAWGQLPGVAQAKSNLISLIVKEQPTC